MTNAHQSSQGVLGDLICGKPCALSSTSPRTLVFFAVEKRYVAPVQRVFRSAVREPSTTNRSEHDTQTFELAAYPQQVLVHADTDAVVLAVAKAFVTNLHALRMLYPRFPVSSGPAHPRIRHVQESTAPSSSSRWKAARRLPAVPARAPFAAPPLPKHDRLCDASTLAAKRRSAKVSPFWSCRRPWRSNKWNSSGRSSSSRQRADPQRIVFAVEHADQHVPHRAAFIGLVRQ